MNHQPTNQEALTLLQEIGIEKVLQLISLMDGKSIKKDGENTIESKIQYPLPQIPGNVKKTKTLGVFRAEYEEFVEGNLSHSYLVSVKNANDHLEGYFGKRYCITDMDLRSAEKFIVYLQSKVPKGYRVYCRNYKAMCKKATDWGYLEANPFSKVKLPKKQQLKPLFLTVEQLDTIIAEVKQDRIEDVIRFGFYTGCRIGEITSLTWKAVDFENKEITIGSDEFTTKNRRQRVIPMCEQVEAILMKQNNRKVMPGTQEIEGNSNADNIYQIVQQPEFVFSKPEGGNYSTDHISKRFKKACREAGVDAGFHFHSLRHSFASNLVQNNVPLYTVMELLGHSSITTTQVYAHLNMHALRDAVNIFNTEKSTGVTNKTKIKELPAERDI